MAFWSGGQKICGFNFGEFSFIVRNIENLVFQSAERGFKGRRTWLVAKCKPEKQRASELAKWVHDCLPLVPLVRSTSLSPSPTPRPSELRPSFSSFTTAPSPFSPRHGSKRRSLPVVVLLGGLLGLGPHHRHGALSNEVPIPPWGTPLLRLHSVYRVSRSYPLLVLSTQLSRCILFFIKLSRCVDFESDTTTEEMRNLKLIRTLVKHIIHFERLSWDILLL